jgi:hypothetical protein
VEVVPTENLRNLTRQVLQLDYLAKKWLYNAVQKWRSYSGARIDVMFE